MVQETWETYKRRATGRAHKLSAGQRVGPVVSISFENPDDLFTFLTRDQLSLLRLVREQSLSISALAAAAGRDIRRVRKDVAALRDLQFVRIHEVSNPGHGRMRVVEPVAHRVELRAVL